MLLKQIYNVPFLIIFMILFLFSACQEQKKKVNIEPVVKSYVEAWNTGDVEKLDSIVTQNFELRIIPTFKPVIGIDSLKKEIIATRTMFPDFTVNIESTTIEGDSVLLGTWTIEGTYSWNADKTTKSEKMSVPGFSVIFFSGEKITGEWIAYSDLTLMKQIGFTLVPPKETKK